MDLGHVTRDFPVRDGATCGCCGGPVDGFGCIAECAESRAWRVDITPQPFSDPAEALAYVGQVAEGFIRQFKPEFVPREMFLIYEVAKGGRP